MLISLYFVSHLPEINLVPKTIVLNNQSQNIANQTPITPIPKEPANTKLKPTLNVHIEKIAIIIVKRTSLAALKLDDKGKAIGQNEQTQRLCTNNIFVASSVASLSSPYSPIKGEDNAQRTTEIEIIKI